MENFCPHTVVGPFQCNCHLIVCPTTGKGALIDSGDEPEKILKLIQTTEKNLGKKITIEYLLHTHGHLDHIGATKKMKAEFPLSTVALHEGDHAIYKMLKDQGRMFGITYDEPTAVEKFLNHEEELKVGELKLKVVHNPGHSPGSVSFLLHEDTAVGMSETLYSGDTLFKSSVGRTDLWGADGPLMMKMIRDRMLSLDDEIGVRPGHGDFSTVGIEKRSNPFFR